MQFLTNKKIKLIKTTQNKDKIFNTSVVMLCLPVACLSAHQKFGIIATVTTKPMKNVNNINGVKILHTGHNPTVTLKNTMRK